MEDFTQSEVQQILWHHVLHFQKVPLQGFYSVPAESVLADYCNIKVTSGKCRPEHADQRDFFLSGVIELR